MRTVVRAPLPNKPDLTGKPHSFHCHAAQLRGVLRPNNGAGGALVGRAILVNVGAHPCYLRGVPSARITGGAETQKLEIHAAPGAAYGPGAVETIEMPAGQRLPHPGTPARIENHQHGTYLALIAQNICGKASTLRLLLRLPRNGGTMSLPFRNFQHCIARIYKASLDVSQFFPYTGRVEVSAG